MSDVEPAVASPGDAGSSSNAAAFLTHSQQPQQSQPLQQHKKKRFHGGTAAAIAARRAGHAGATTTSGQGLGAGAQNNEEPAFISSSRDASEEDNDEASGYSDSASSLRLPQRASQSALPVSARDKAVVDSKELHRRLNLTTTNAADKTPSSSSPPRQQTSALQGPAADHDALAGRTIASEVGAAGGGIAPGAGRDPQTSHVLSKATAALVSSSSAEFGEDLSVKAAHILPRGSATSSLARQESSAGSEASDTGRDRRLNLGSLPGPPDFATGMQQHQILSAVTPKGAAPLMPIREAKKKGSLLTKANSELDGHGRDGVDGDADGTAANAYDGDVEYSARAPASQQVSPGFPGPAAVAVAAASGGATSGTPLATTPGAVQAFGPSHSTSTAPIDIPSRRYVSSLHAASLTKADPIAAAGVGAGRDQPPAAPVEKPIPMASPSNIRNFIYRAIYEPDPARPYRINVPPDGGKNPARPVRIYADGVYDLFHYAHALQLRQAKLCFPSVHLIVGVVSSELCASHKNTPVMTSQERYAAVRNCKWVDEVVEDAPWVITQELLDKLSIDYVAHDELPYAGAGTSADMADVYQFVKDQGRFLPTQRTEGVSTSELLARIVQQYRSHNYDQKLAKIGHQELAFE